MVRGWAPAVEAELIAAGRRRRARPASRSPTRPPSPTAIAPAPRPRTRAADILRLCGLGRRHDRDGPASTRLAIDAPGQLQLKTYRKGGLIPLSEAVPVLENFGFRVLEEMPTPLAGGASAISTTSASRSAGEADLGPILARAGEIERGDRRRAARASPRTTSSTSWCSTPGSSRRRSCWLRAWFRYLRQTGSSFGLVTVVDALRRAPAATRALIGLFAAAHDPAAARARRSGREAAAADSTAGSPRSRSIDDDRILRPPARAGRGDPAHQRLRSGGRGSARLQARIRRWSPACRRRCRGARSGSTARGSRASICAAARSPAAAFAGPTGATISAPRSSA